MAARRWMSAAVVGMVAGLLGCASVEPMEPGVFEEEIRQELSGEPADSDAAWILSRALEAAGEAPADERLGVLRDARRRARDARQFKIAKESPLPQGWPRPSLPGLVRIKTYPPVRSAWVRAPQKGTGQFMVLFRHIQDQQIAMTAPVVMEYSDAAARDPSTLGSAEAMAFLYRRADQGQAGEYGAVVVGNDRPVRVLSVALKGSYREANFRKALGELSRWLDAHPRYRRAGAPRVLAYNSPFLLWFLKYSEVQIPIVEASGG